MTKKDFIQTIRETEGLLISLTNATQDLDEAVMDILRRLETIAIETEESTDKYLYKYLSGEEKRDCLVFDKEGEFGNK